jgi:hypothetical protein
MPDGLLQSAELFEPRTGAFVPTGSLQTPREDATETVLLDGRVLVAGGIGTGATGQDALASAELYNPTTGKFTLTKGPMTTARAWHTATLLPDGRVLVTGGIGSLNGERYLASAELFDPKTGKFTATKGPMTNGRAWQTATLLPDGRVLVAGGAGDHGYLASAELFDPKTGKFSLTTSSMTTARDRHTATLLKDGRVLVAGGAGNEGYLASTELYNPTTGMFDPAGSMTVERADSGAAVMQDGRVLIAGGANTTGILTSAEVYDPSAYTFATTGPMSIGRTSPTITPLGNGQVLVAGGGAGSIDPADLYTP